MLNHSNNTCSNLQYPFNANSAFLDSAATDNYGNEQTPLLNKRSMRNTVPIHLTNGSTMIPTQKGTLPNMPDIISKHKTCQICPNNNGPVLLSIGQLCDDNCLAVCRKKKCIIYKNKPIIRAQRCPISGMYVTDLHNPLLKPTKVSILHANLQQFTSIERLKFLHGALDFPPISTLRRAIAAGYLLSFPDMTEKNISKFPTQDITVLGHMDQKRKNI